MDGHKAYAVPLVDLLRSVPRSARYDQEISPTHYSFHPVGRLCHEAAEEIARLTAAGSALLALLKAYEDLYAMHRKFNACQCDLGSCKWCVQYAAIEAARKAVWA